jgi:hypothetical protein
MKHLGCVLLLLPLSGCVLLLASSPKEDGEQCDEASDCESDNCMGNICVGSSCSDTSDCPDNFRCYYYDGDPIFGIGDHHACRLACDASGACPAQWECHSGDTYCTYVGPTVTVAVSNEQPRAHEVVTFAGTIDPPVDGVTWTWGFPDLGVTKTGSLVEMTFDQGFWSWSVTADGRNGSHHYDTGSIYACAVTGDACSASAPCCSDLVCNSQTMTCN